MSTDKYVGHPTGCGGGERGLLSLHVALKCFARVVEYQYRTSVRMYSKDVPITLPE